MKNIRNTLLLFALYAIFISPNNSFAQTQTLAEADTFYFPSSLPQYNNNVGLTASFFTGVGLHYKRNITPEHSVKLVFSGWHSSSDDGNYYYLDNNDFTFLSFGLEYQYHIFRKPKFDFYALAAARTWYTEDTYRTSGTEIINNNSVGIGVGTEYRFGRHFVINIEGGFVNSWSLERRFFTENHTKREAYFGLSGGIGMGFIF